MNGIPFTELWDPGNKTWILEGVERVRKEGGRERRRMMVSGAYHVKEN